MRWKVDNRETKIKTKEGGGKDVGFLQIAQPSFQKRKINGQEKFLLDLGNQHLTSPVATGCSSCVGLGCEIRGSSMGLASRISRCTRGDGRHNAGLPALLSRICDMLPYVA